VSTCGVWIRNVVETPLGRKTNTKSWRWRWWWEWEWDRWVFREEMKAGVEEQGVPLGQHTIRAVLVVVLPSPCTGGRPVHPNMKSLSQVFHVSQKSYSPSKPASKMGDSCSSTSLINPPKGPSRLLLKEINISSSKRPLSRLKCFSFTILKI
jgi:hypothetical protein